MFQWKGNTHQPECPLGRLELTWDTVGEAADCCGTLVDIADTRGKTRGSRGTLADTADVGDIGIRTQEPRHHYLIRQGDPAAGGLGSDKATFLFSTILREGVTN